MKMNATAACNLIVANYNALTLILETAIALPRKLLLLCDKLVKITEGLTVDGVQSVCSFFVGNSLNLKVPESADPSNMVKEILLCPLITRLMPEDKLDKYLEDIDKYIASGNFPEEGILSDSVTEGVNAAMGFVTGDMHKLLETHVYMQINNLIAQVENLLYADLKDLNCPGESVMSIISYLQLGNECIDTMCDNMKGLITPFDNYVTQLKLSLNAGVISFSPWKDYPTELHDACKEASYEVAEAVTAIEGVNDAIPKPKPKDPYEVSVWKNK